MAYIFSILIKLYHFWRVIKHKSVSGFKPEITPHYKRVYSSYVLSSDWLKSIVQNTKDT